MYRVNNFLNNDDVKVLDKLGAFMVVEYQRDLSVTPETAMRAYYSSQMNVRKRQILSQEWIIPQRIMHRL